MEGNLSRSPPWSRDELILALDFYMAHRDESLPDVRGVEIRSRSEKLNTHAHRIGLSGDERCPPSAPMGHLEVIAQRRVSGSS